MNRSPGEIDPGPRLRVLQLVHKPQRRGAEVFADQLSRALRRDGHHVASVYLYPHSRSGSLELGGDDRLLEGDEWHWSERIPGVNPRLLVQLRRRIASWQPDLLQANGGRTVKYAAFAVRGQRDGGPALVYRNIGDPRDWAATWTRRVFYDRLVMPRIDGIIGVSRSTLDALKRMYGLTIPTELVPNGVDVDALLPSRDSDTVRAELETALDDPLVIFVGSLSAEKRPDRLLRVCAAAAVQLGRLTVWLLGEGPLRDSLATQVAGLDAPLKVRIAGSRARVGDYIAAADLLLLSSDTEGIPAVVLEAGALGVPTVATRVGGVAECIRHGETGLLVERDDEAGMASAIADLLRDGERRHGLGRTAAAWVQSNFAMTTVAKRYLEFYRRVLDSRREPAAGASS